MKKKLYSLQSLLLVVVLLFGGLNLHAQCPTVFSVTGGGSRCSNGSGVRIGINGSQKGVSYQVMRDGIAVSTLNGSGYPLNIITTSAGTYTINATNTTSGCQVVMNGNAIITINAAPNFSAVTTDVSCMGSDGSITVSGSGGTPGYLFNIDGGAFSASNTFPGLSVGNHTIAIQDANTCSISKAIPVQGAPALSVTISIVDPGDCSGTNGSITANRVGGVDDGVTAVQYKLDGSVTRPYQNSNIFAGLSKGDYTITVKDSKGCTAVSSTVSLTQVAGTAPTIFNVTGGGAICAGGAATIFLSGSETGVTYQLSNNGSPVGTSVTGTGNPISLPSSNAGTYKIVATNTTAGCVNIMNGTATVTVNPLPIAYSMKGGGDRCSNGGNITIGVTGSQTGVQYKFFKNGDMTHVTATLNGSGHPLGFPTSQPGTYTAIAVSSAGCTTNINGTAIVNVNTPPTVFSVSGGGTRCYEASQIAVNLSGSQTGVNYQLINGSSSVGGPVAGTGSPISLQATDAGTYTVVATNVTTGCVSNMTGSVSVSVNPQLTPTFTKYYASSCVGGDGTITVTGNGGTPGYMYSVDNGPFTTTTYITGLAAGEHVLQVKDAKSCLFTWIDVTILTAPIMQVNTTVVKPSSCSGNDGSIKALYYGGVVDGITPLEYKLGGDATVPFQLSNTFPGLSAGTYTVTIKDSKGCLASTSVTLTTASPITFSPNSYSTDVSSCGNGMDGSVTVRITGGQYPFHFSIDGTEIGQSNNPAFGFANLGVGTHTVSVTDIHGTCAATQDFTISQATAPVAKIIYKGNETCIGKNNGYITLSPTAIGGVPGYMYSKDGGTTYQGSMSFTNLSPGSYSMVVKDSKGCLSAPVTVVINAGQQACPPVSDGGGNLITATGLDGKILIGSSLNIRAYPNPFASNLTLNVMGNNKEKIAIVVTDVFGRKLSEVKGSANQQYIIGNHLGRGIYIVTVLQGDKVQTIKIVKE